MKKILVVFFSLLLVFLMVPVLPNAVYAADAPARDAHVVSPHTQLANLPTVEKMAKIPGAGKVVEGGLRAVEPKTFSDASAFVEDANLPKTGWIAIDADGDGFNWKEGTEFDGRMSSLSGTDNMAIYSESFDNNSGSVLTPDNWLISPAIQVPADTQLQFFVCGQDPSWCREHYGVFVSTTSQTDTTTFTKLYEETVTSGDFEGRAVDLTAYAGQTVYLAFRHFNVSDMFVLNLDGISFSKAGTTPVVPKTPPEIIRVFGQNRYDTSIEIGTFLIEQIRYQQENDNLVYPAAIIATGDNFPDALAGSALSTAEVAPILLISSKVPASVDAALSFIKTNVHPDGTIYILGGTGAVPASVEASLDELGYAYHRFGGQDRYETNLEVLELLNEEGELLYEDSDNIELLVCDGTNWPDAATASATGYPILLAPKKGFTDAQWDFIKKITEYDEAADTVGNKIYFDFIGGEGAVTAEVLNSVSKYELDGGESIRLAGANRAETATEVADFFAGDPKIVTFAYGVNFPDCISGGLLSWFFDSPILYGDSKNPTTYMNAGAPYVASNVSDWVYAFVYGGEGLVGDQFILDLFNASQQIA